jgi:hypothetical protein
LNSGERFGPWISPQRVHEVVAVLMVFGGLGHSGATFFAFDERSPEAMWFMSAGLMMAFLGFLNLAAAGARGRVRRLSLLTEAANVLAAVFLIPLYLTMRALVSIGLLSLAAVAFWLELRNLRARPRS